MKLYKFRTFDDNGYSLDALRNSYVWFSSSTNLNDPFEGYSNIDKLQLDSIAEPLTIKMYKTLILQLGLATNLVEAELMTRKRYMGDLKGFKAMTRDTIKHFVQNLNDGRSELGILSTSANPENMERIPPQYQNMLMWSHYADGFKGFCIEWNQDRLLESLKQLNGESKIACAPVQYVDRPHVCDFDVVDDVSQVALNFMQSLQYKHRQWQYEYEYRFLADSQGGLRYNPESIEAVYLGGSATQENVEETLEIVDRLGLEIPVKQVNVAAGQSEYGLTVNRLN